MRRWPCTDMALPNRTTSLYNKRFSRSLSLTQPFEATSARKIRTYCLLFFSYVEMWAGLTFWRFGMSTRKRCIFILIGECRPPSIFVTRSLHVTVVTRHVRGAKGVFHMMLRIPLLSGTCHGGCV
ncbi:hypothetical protein EJ05DRAFT_13658 [Pseudovirgaria hyperparasitica]|uniref:Uncharacterized protein n=1 Tax=Pseudovirgaria hyperparasitica TaxID=470096 RepID=A0A6A6WKR5_9PEZI|nr:uncharacterized protein EJ05DRAFT_13658 [Pseudovirgaria hyperparasitica]KAF2762762.1 hypothetical protein EJ05DRAFT_13658 [Pseudovirgaria hyperparasitica]